MRNAEGKLPVVTEVAETACGCDRRTVLGGLAVGALVAGCRIDDPGAAGDAGVTDTPTDGVPGTGFELCDANLCLDLTHPQNAALLNVGGSRAVVQATKKIIIVRTSETAFATLTSVCTHAGCTVKFAVAANQLQCPCHGSKFGIDGTVAVGPATRDLTTFSNTFDAAGNLLTITL